MTRPTSWLASAASRAPYRAPDLMVACRVCVEWLSLSVSSLVLSQSSQRRGCRAEMQCRKWKVGVWMGWDGRIVSSKGEEEGSISHPARVRCALVSLFWPTKRPGTSDRATEGRKESKATDALPGNECMMHALLPLLVTPSCSSCSPSPLPLPLPPSSCRIHTQRPNGPSTHSLIFLLLFSLSSLHFVHRSFSDVFH